MGVSRGERKIAESEELAVRQAVCGVWSFRTSVVGSNVTVWPGFTLSIYAHVALDLVRVVSPAWGSPD
jgi:hypothetical protein